jgi:hypothetical protein
MQKNGSLRQRFRVSESWALQGYWAVDRKTGKSVVVTFWKDEAAATPRIT